MAFWLSLVLAALTVSAAESAFKKVYSLDMTNSGESCPTGFKLQTPGSKRLCGKGGSGCTSIAVPVNGQSYTKVRGRVIAYQYASTDAFNSGSTNIDGVYVDGVSITHGKSPRKHVWTLGSGIIIYGSESSTCPNTGHGKPQPAWVGSNYFCSSGNTAASGWGYKFYDVPLWSRITGNCEDCSSRYTVPHFCRELPQATNEDLEIRVCANQGLSDEDIQVEAIDLYIK